MLQLKQQPFVQIAVGNQLKVYNVVLCKLSKVLEASDQSQALNHVLCRVCLW